MNSQNIEKEVSELLVTLSLPVSEEELSGGWSAGSKKAAERYFNELHTCIRDNKPLPPLGIVRSLDHWGVVGGNLLEKIAKITNWLRAK